MLITLGVGVLSSIIVEVATWANKKLEGTVLQGRGAFLLALLVSFVMAGWKVLAVQGASVTWGSLGTTFAQVWTVAQIFFVVVVETFHLDVQSPASTVQG